MLRGPRSVESALPQYGRRAASTSSSPFSACCLPFVYCSDAAGISSLMVSVSVLSGVCVCVCVCLNKLYCLSLDDGDGVVRRGELRRALTRPKKSVCLSLGLAATSPVTAVESERRRQQTSRVGRKEGRGGTESANAEADETETRRRDATRRKRGRRDDHGLFPRRRQRLQSSSLDILFSKTYLYATRHPAPRNTHLDHLLARYSSGPPTPSSLRPAGVLFACGSTERQPLPPQARHWPQSRTPDIIVRYHHFTRKTKSPIFEPVEHLPSIYTLD